MTWHFCDVKVTSPQKYLKQFGNYNGEWDMWTQQGTVEYHRSIFCASKFKQNAYDLQTKRWSARMFTPTFQGQY